MLSSRYSKYQVGNPVCEAGLVIHKDGKTTNSGHTCQKFCCPFRQSKTGCYPCNHKSWNNGRKNRGCMKYKTICALPGFVDSKNEEKTERNAGYLVVSQSGGGMLRQGTRKGIRRTPANRGMRAHWVVKGLDISEDVCHGMCP